MSETKLTAEEAYFKLSLLKGKRVYDKETGEELGILTGIRQNSGKDRGDGVVVIEDYIFSFDAGVADKIINSMQMLKFEDKGTQQGPPGSVPGTGSVPGGKKRRQSKRRQSKRKQSKRKQSRKSRR